jgi:DNA-binding transcriptional regulator YiaG
MPDTRKSDTDEPIIYPSPNKRMAGVTLRRLRVAAQLSEQDLAGRLGTYRRRIQRWESSAWFELHSKGMDQLLKTLGVDKI